MIFTIIAEVVDKLDKLFDLIRGIEDPSVVTTQEMLSETKELICEIKGMFGGKHGKTND